MYIFKSCFVFSLRKASWLLFTVRRAFFGSFSFGTLASARLLVSDPKKELVGGKGIQTHIYIHEHSHLTHASACINSHTHIPENLKHSFYEVFFKEVNFIYLQNLHDLDIPLISLCNHGPFLKRPFLSIHMILPWPWLIELKDGYLTQVQMIHILAKN